jgi:hypothetical protein
MYTIEKKRKEGYYYVTRQYFILTAHPFMNFKTFVDARKGMRNTPKTCFVCNHKFADDETIYLAPVVRDKNRIVCEHCATIINKHQ